MGQKKHPSLVFWYLEIEINGGNMLLELVYLIYMRTYYKVLSQKLKYAVTYEFQ